MVAFYVPVMVAQGRISLCRSRLDDARIPCRSMAAFRRSSAATISGVRRDAELADPLSNGSRGPELALRSLRGCGAFERGRRSSVRQGTPAGLRRQLSAVSGAPEGWRRHSAQRPWHGLQLGLRISRLGLHWRALGPDRREWRHCRREHQYFVGHHPDDRRGLLPHQELGDRSDLLHCAGSHSGHRHDRQRLRSHLGVPAVHHGAISLHQFRRFPTLRRRRRELHHLLEYPRQ